MKKISAMLLALGTALAFTACQESKDDHPVVKTHEGDATAVFLNTPEMTNMAILITEANNTGSIHMQCSQPDYGFSAYVRYEVEVSLSEDFTTPKVSGCPASQVLNTTFSDPKEVNPVLSEIAAAMCKMLDISNESQVPTAYYPLYIRLIANVASVAGGVHPNTTYISNTVKIQGVCCGYLAISVPGLPSGIYLRGAMNDWGAESAWEFLTTDEFNIYEIANCQIGAGVEFKVADDSWGAINQGGGTVTINQPYVMEDNGGNMSVATDFDGRVQLTVKGDTYTLLLEMAE